MPLEVGKGTFWIVDKSIFQKSEGLPQCHPCIFIDIHELLGRNWQLKDVLTNRIHARLCVRNLREKPAFWKCHEKKRGYLP